MRKNYNFATQADLLEHLADRVDQTTADFVDLTVNLTSDQLRWRPEQNQWSIAECVSHILLVDGPYVSQIEKQYSVGPVDPAPSDAYMTSWAGRLMLNTVDPDTARRVPTVGAFKPVEIPVDFIADFVEHQERLKKSIKESAARNLNLVRVSSPVSKLIRFRLGECLHFLVIHQIRHLHQARRVRLDSNFPES
ncbi:MAG: DinB family protein [Rhodothermales bacterium]|nr:DinB family protein [Rhodothermales bacterium]